MVPSSQTFRLFRTGTNAVSTSYQTIFAKEPISNVVPTWTYTPYQAPEPSRRRMSSDLQWKVPKRFKVPEDKVELNFVRSSGAGGQNVNKVNTKVEMKFHVMTAEWIPKEVRERVREQQSKRINKDGYLTLSSQEYRTQGQNRQNALDKLESIVLEAYPRPKERKMRKGISKATKERNKDFKKRRSQVKKSRGRVDF